jgi:uncharacterized membrane protein YidH (DUF202 family)
MKEAAGVLLGLFVLGAAALGTIHWIRTLRDVERRESDPKERAKWWRRVFFLRLIGVLWYESHCRKATGSDSTAMPR